MAYQRTQSDFDDLSAWLDGELPAERAAEVERLVADDPAWRTACDELRTVDAALDAWAPPEPSAGLADRVLRYCHAAGRRRHLLRVAAWMAPAAAVAAAILIVIAAMGRGPRKSPVAPTPIVEAPIGDESVKDELARSKAFEAIPADQREDVQKVLIQHLSFFREYEVLEDFETLEAIDRIEEQGT